MQLGRPTKPLWQGGMTFRGRLRLFFVLIVVVPMLATGGVLFVLVGQSTESAADGRLESAVRVALDAHSEARGQAQDDLDRVVRGRALRAALSNGDSTQIQIALDRVVAADRRVVEVVVTPAAGGRLEAGGEGVAAATATVSRSDGRRLGVVAVSVTRGGALTALIRRRTGYDAEIIDDGRRRATTLAGVEAPAGEAGGFEAGGESFRGLRREAATGEELALFSSSEALETRILRARLIVGGVVLLFLILALLSSAMIVRALQRQIGEFLTAAKRLASGRFDEQFVPEGEDEFAQLGREFNGMSQQLAAKIAEVDRKRVELEETIGRVGQAFAAGLDSQAALRLTIETAVEACDADAGRATPDAASGLEQVEVDVGSAELDRALAEMELELERVTGPTEERGAKRSVAHDTGDVHAIGVTLFARLGERGRGQSVSRLTIARSGRPFGKREREILEYLAGQAVISIENADLHETVQRQAVTDDLTGLSNVRELNAALDREFERGRRFGTPMAFVLLDIDDFKRVNDDYGHQLGDEVLRRVAAVVKRHSREIDEPARYGGEELAIVLPQTTVDGARRLAERVRAGIERLQIPAPESGQLIRVTASFGVAAIPASASDKDGLIHAADEALYRSKRAGKNRIESAGELPATDAAPVWTGER